MLRASIVRAAITAALMLSALANQSRCEPHQEPKSPRQRPSFLGEPKSPEFVRFVTTTFVMGSPVADVLSKSYRPEEKPQHKRTVAAFGMARFLVTAEEYCLFLNDAGNDGYMLDRPLLRQYGTIVEKNGRFRPRPRAERSPATLITWRGADAYARWLAKKLHQPIRLPTEAEWELAARGKELREYPWGKDKPFVVHDNKPIFPNLFAGDDSIEIRYRDDLGGREIPLGEYFFGGPPRSRPPKRWPEAPVGSYPRNATPDGVLDLVGNVYGQWCSDVFDAESYSREPPAAPIAKPDKKELRVQRGMAEVPISGNALALFAKQDRIPLRLILPMGDARWDLNVRARTWSRVGRNPRKDSGRVRLAITIPPEKASVRPKE